MKAEIKNLPVFDPVFFPIEAFIISQLKGDMQC